MSYEWGCPLRLAYMWTDGLNWTTIFIVFIKEEKEGWLLGTLVTATRMWFSQVHDHPEPMDLQDCIVQGAAESLGSLQL